MTAEERSKNESGIKDPGESEPKHPSIDRGYAWVVLCGSFVISFILDGIMYSFGVILTPIKEHYGVANDVANLLSSFNTGFLFCSGPIVAGLANQFGCRTVVMGGAIVTSLMYFLTVFSPTIYVCIVFYGIIGGLSTGCTYLASLIIIAEYFDKKRGIATGITMAGSGVGSFVFSPLIQYLIRTYDWKFTISVCSSIILQACVCGALLRPLPAINEPLQAKKSKQVELKAIGDKSGSSEQQRQNSTEDRVIETFSGSVYSLNAADKDLPFYQRNKLLRIVIGILKEMTDFRLLVQNFPFLLVTLSNLFIFLGYFTPFLFITKVADNNNIENSSLLISIIGIVNIPFRMLFGLIADRRWVSAINLNTLSVLIATVPLFLYKALQYTFWSQAIFSFLFAVGMAGMNSLTTMYLVEIVGMKKFSNATGIINLFRGFGCFLGPFIGGLIADKYDMITAFYYSGLCFSVGLVLTALVSFSSMLMGCCGRAKDETINADDNKTVDDSEHNRNLLNSKA